MATGVFTLYLIGVISALLKVSAGRGSSSSAASQIAPDLESDAPVIASKFIQVSRVVVRVGEHVLDADSTGLRGSHRDKEVHKVPGSQIAYRSSTAVDFDNAAPLISMPRSIWQHFRHHTEQGTGSISTLEATPSADLNSTWWIAGFIATLLSLGVLLMLYSSYRRVEFKDPEDEELVSVLGRPCWNTCCVTFYVISSLFLFWVTFATATSINEGIESNPEVIMKVNTTQGVLRKSYDLHMINPGECAYLTAMGLMLSMAVACVTLVNWRNFGDVKMTSSILIQFMLRGASLSVVVAVLLESCGSALLTARSNQLGALNKFSVGGALMMLVVGFSEEFAKIIAATCGICLSVAALKDAHRGCCCCFNRQCCQLLIETPKALALAGVAAGFGFMIIENVEYVLSTTLQPSMDPSGKNANSEDGSPDDMFGVSTFFNIAVITVRVLLNIHPWLTGVSALRIGHIAFEKGEPMSACLGPSDIIWAVMPSALIHAAYDFTIVSLPLLAVVAVPAIWYCSRQFFYSEWVKTDVGQEDDLAGR